MYRKLWLMVWSAGTVVCITGSASPLAAQHCGQERWAVKTGTDPDVGRVDLSNPKNTTIADLVRLTAPSPLPTNTRFAPTEDTVFVLNATLRQYKIESGPHGDSDYHLVLEDGSGHTMVAEIPLPACVGPGSPFAGQIASTRAKFDAQFTVTPSFQTAGIPVQVKGVGFFDFFHNQTGAAPNVIELHPVLDITFGPPPVSVPDFALSLSSPAASVNQGGSSSTVISTTGSNGFDIGSVSLAVAGLPSGVTATITPAGAGSSTLTLLAAPGAAAGTFPVAVTGTGGGKSHTVTLMLTVNPSAAPCAPTQEWEYRSITAATEADLINQANSLGSQEWELVSVVRNQTGPAYVGFLKRPKRAF
jgi:hypothetical protein